MTFQNSESPNQIVKGQLAIRIQPGRYRLSLVGATPADYSWLTPYTGDNVEPNLDPFADDPRFFFGVVATALMPVEFIHNQDSDVTVAVTGGAFAVITKLTE